MQILSASYPGALGDYQSIATTTVGVGGVATVTFSGISSGYSHLQLRILCRTNRAATTGTLLMNFNGDSAANYSIHQLIGDGATASSSATTGSAYVFAGNVAGNTATAGVFGVAIIDILDYANTNKYKTTRTFTGNDNNGSGDVRLMSGNWRSTAAITSIVITESTAANMNQYSSFALYGIKG